EAGADPLPSPVDSEPGPQAVGRWQLGVDRNPGHGQPLDPESDLLVAERAGIEQLARVDGDVVVAEAHQKQGNTAHGSVGTRPPGNHAIVVDTAGLRRTQGRILRKTGAAEPFRGAPEANRTDVGPGKGLLLQQPDML